MGKNQPKKQTLQINIQKSSGWIFMKVDEMLEKFVIDTNCFWKYILRYLLLLKKKTSALNPQNPQNLLGDGNLLKCDAQQLKEWRGMHCILQSNHCKGLNQIV